MAMEYRTGPHTKYKIEYHFVWITKYRYQVLNGEVAIRLREMVRQVCTSFDLEIKRGVVSKDHVHLLLSAPPTISPAEIMRRIKGKTSLKLFEEFPHLKKRYWGRHFWARGYFCVTAGELTQQMIKEYLDHHFEGKENPNFEIES
jgi:putative transposase